MKEEQVHRNVTRAQVQLWETFLSTKSFNIVSTTQKEETPSQPRTFVTNKQLLENRRSCEKKKKKMV